jgi:methyl coenzyme M reductase gamma subunit
MFSATLTQNLIVRSTDLYKIPENTIVMSICWMQLSKVTTEVYNFGRILVMGTTSHGHSGKKKKSFFFFFAKKLFNINEKKGHI